MATTVSTATMTVTLTESISLAGEDQGASNVFTIAAVQEVSKRIVTVETTERIILAMNTFIAAGQFVETLVRYIRIANKDDTNFVILVFRSEGSAEFAVKLDAGQFFIYNADNSGGVVDTMDASASALTVALEDLVDITALADTAAVVVELFVVGV